MDEGEIVVDSVEMISLQDVNHDLAIESGFENRVDLMKVAKHGAGENVYLVRFHYVLAEHVEKKSDKARRLPKA